MLNSTDSYRVLETSSLSEWSEALGERLIGLGAMGVEHIEESVDRDRLKAYFPSSPASSPSLEEVADQIGRWYLEAAGEALELRPTLLPPMDWVAENRRQLAPFPLLDDLWLIPEPDSRFPHPSVIVQAGGAFGTGRHPTTRLCAWALRELATELKEGAGAVSRNLRGLDVGTGSGVLAILAIYFGCADRLVALDHDPETLEYARHNVEANGMADRIEIRIADLRTAPSGFDWGVANLTAPILRESAGELLAKIRPGGWMILGGMLEEEAPEVEALYQRLGAVSRRSRLEEGWTALLLQTPLSAAGAG